MWGHLLLCWLAWIHGQDSALCTEDKIKKRFGREREREREREFLLRLLMKDTLVIIFRGIRGR